MSIAAQLADFVFIEKEKGSIFVNPQRVVSNAIGDNPYVEALNDGTFEWAEIVEKIHDIVDILPSSSKFAPNVLEVSDEDLNRSCDGIEDSLGDARAILAELSDDGRLIECRSEEGQSIVTGFIRIAGMPLGVVACNEFEGKKRLTAAGCNKAAKLIDLCTRFHIPLLTITDTDGYNTDSATEILLPSAAERMVRALTASDVPKINLVTGSIVGSAYSMMNSKGLGADYVFMWDSANVSIVEPRQATEVIFGKWSSELEQQFRDTQSSAVALARHGFADKVIAPEDSRKYLIGALQTFVNSR
jgi:acetyl-CoA carboxylase carboxyltransferase component